MSKSVENLTPNAKAYFEAAVKDAGNWNGNPLVNGNFTILSAKEDRGLLTACKRADLLTTWHDDEMNSEYIQFTEFGRAEAKRVLGVEL